ncbi:MAG: hypothetical protein ONB30_03610 [candidate division KSB1 bacterium]|nr:hypothetical protein [candidate division KSB1 bacterium]
MAVSGFSLAIRPAAADGLGYWVWAGAVVLDITRIGRKRGHVYYTQVY